MSRMRKPFTLAPAVEAEPTDQVVAFTDTQDPSSFTNKPEEPAPPTLPLGGRIRFALYQVINPQSNMFGLVFALGDATDVDLHGYHIIPGRTKTFITVPIADCKHVGMSEVKARNATITEWNKNQQQ